VTTVPPTHHDAAAALAQVVRANCDPEWNQFLEMKVRGGR
jgi:hypothetical protein